MIRRWMALILSGAMMLSLCQVSLAVQDAEDPAPVKETALTDEISPEEQSVPEEEAAPTETTTAVSETAVGAAASQQPATAAESTGAVYNGTLGDAVEWSLDTASGALAITGSGAMKNYGAGAYGGTSPLYNYRSYIKSVTIADEITSVGDYVFYGFTNLTTVDFGSGITSIGGHAFQKCSALAEINIPDSVAEVCDYAFCGCTNLNNLDLGSGVIGIGDCAFYNCRTMKTVVIPDSVIIVGNHAFEQCESLISVTIGNGVGEIGSCAFGFCGSLTSVIIGTGITTIGNQAFGGYNRLSTVKFLGNAPANFGTDVFYDASSTFTVFYHSGTSGWTSPTWNGYAATCIDEEITDFSTLDDSNRNAQHILFQLNDTAMTATVGQNTSGGNNAGYDGGYNGKIVIPDIVTKDGKEYKVIGINQYAFANCPWVYTVSVGKNVSAIEPSAFRGCKNLAAITVDEGNLQFADQEGVLFDKEGLYLYAYPAGCPADTYEIPSTCTTVGTQAFYGASNLVELTVPTSVNDIGKAAFGNCNALQSIELPFFGGNAQSTATVGYVVISEDVWGNKTIPESLKRITVRGTNLPGTAFCNCSDLEEIYLPDCGSLTEIPYQCFSGCSSLQTLVFGTASSEDGMVMIPNTVTTIRSNAFAGCSSLRGITLGRGVTTLGGKAFENCSSVEKYVVASGNTSFMADQWGVLYSADQTMLHYYPSARAWPYYNVSDKTTTICEYAFSSCTELVNLFIPKTATSLSSCISDCPSTTICCYNGSAAARYAISSGITSWYMDNYVMQGIQGLQLPEQLVFNTRSALSSSPYLTATYGDKTLQLDDYQVVLEKPYGEQTVTFTAGGCSVTAKTSVVRQGDINGDSTTTASVVDAQDMQCLYEYLSKDENNGQITDNTYFEQVCDFNGDGRIDILDYQGLYANIKGNC